tara:strand:- start:3093 stop:3266 length:174 start_codon:yes stop_codon:yes gene_type:complete
VRYQTAPRPDTAAVVDLMQPNAGDIVLESLSLWKQSSLEFINNTELNQVVDVIKDTG